MKKATIEQVRSALKKAKQFIENGVEFGFIRMPDADTPDPAHNTLPLIEAALAALSSAESEPTTHDSAVRVCPERDCECGSRPAAWCPTCPKRFKVPPSSTHSDVSQDGGNGEAKPFQLRVQPWMQECFGPVIAADTQERNHRFLEESLELVQACGATQSEAHQLVDYVYGRPVGDKHQEVGGVMVTLAALCLAQGLDMHAAGEDELARIWTKIEQIRAKQAAKPKHSPLPIAASQPETPALTDAVADLYKLFVELTNGQQIAEDGAIIGYVILNSQLDRLESLVAALPILTRAAVEPMEIPLPCDVTIGAGTIKKGVLLRILVKRMEVLHKMAMAASPDAQAIRDQALEALEVAFGHIDSIAHCNDHALVERAIGLLKSQATQPAREQGCDWEEDFPNDNGQYFHICRRCKQEFIGHKHRMVCKLCDAGEEIKRLQQELSEFRSERQVMDIYRSIKSLSMADMGLMSKWIAERASLAQPSQVTDAHPYLAGDMDTVRRALEADERTRLTPKQCAAQFRLYAEGSQNNEAKRQLNLCADFLDEYCMSIAQSPARQEQWKAALEEERRKFQGETLRTSNLMIELQKFVKQHEDTHTPGPWSRGCHLCQLVAEANALLSQVAQPQQGETK